MNILGHIPKDYFVVACSGGMDSMVLVDFLRHYPQNKFGLVFFDHGTSDCTSAKAFLKLYTQEFNIELTIGTTSKPKTKDESLEEYWRNQRYEFLSQFNCPILMAHHLDDVVETYVMSTIKGGNPKLIPYRRQNVIRPLLLTSFDEIKAWAIRNNVRYVEDKSNQNTCHLRNYVRHVVMPHILHINPGIHKMIRKKVIEEFKLQEEGKHEINA